MTEISTEDLRSAIQRVAQSRDGELLYLWLQKRLMALPVVGCSDSDLQKFEGGRMLAGELFGLMSEGIRLSGRDDSRRPVIFKLAGSERADSRPRFTIARRVSLDKPVPGYDADPDAPDRHPGDPGPA
jgi:hypothetical protein